MDSDLRAWNNVAYTMIGVGVGAAAGSVAATTATALGAGAVLTTAVGGAAGGAVGGAISGIPEGQAGRNALVGAFTGTAVGLGFGIISGALAANATDGIFVIGRQVDTAVAKSWPGHQVLDIADWTLSKDDAWIQSIIDRNGVVYVASPQNSATLWDAVNARPTVFARELEQLLNAGYEWASDYLLPPS